MELIPEFIEPIAFKFNGAKRSRMKQSNRISSILLWEDLNDDQTV